MPEDLKKRYERTMIGKRFGRLLIQSFNKSEKKIGYSRTYWNCVCDCGNVCIVRQDSLSRGKRKSCGCLLEEYNSKKHGHRTPEGQTSLKSLYGKYKDSARKRKLVFEITQNQFKYLIEQDCYYCGDKPNSIYEMKDANGKIVYNGIDRIDSNKGYTPDNIVPCCGRCNHAKMDKDANLLIGWLERIKKSSFSLMEMQYVRDN